MRTAGGQVIQGHEVRSARIEGLRGVGSTGVLVAHVFGVSVSYGVYAYDTLLHRLLLGAGFGAFVLLSLSGYLLALPFFRRDFDGGAEVSLRRYARNRVLRVFPLYYAVLVVVMLTQEHGGHLGQWWRFLTFSQNFSPSTVGQVDGPMWTLVDELHFYLLLPPLAWLLGRLSRGHLAPAALALGALAGLSILTEVLWVENHPHPDLVLAYSTPANFFYFIAGMLVALAHVFVDRRGSLPGLLGRSDAWCAAALLTWFVVCWRYRDFALLALVSMFTLAGTVLPLRPGVLAPILSARVLAAVGVASYSLYLWHYPIVTWLGAHAALHSFGVLLLTAGSLSVIVALLSYRFIEAPFLRMRRRWSPAAARQES